MSCAQHERFPDAAELEQERIGAGKTMHLRVKWRVRSNGRWNSQTGRRDEMLALSRNLARDSNVDRMDFEDVEVEHYPTELGGGVITPDDGTCPMCGALSGQCESFCELARLP